MKRLATDRTKPQSVRTELPSLWHGFIQLGFIQLRWIQLLAVALAIAASLPAYDPGLGKRDPALRPCDQHYDRGRRAEAYRCYHTVIQSTGNPATQAEAYWRLHDVKRANELFRAAVAADPEDPDARVRWGYLFLQTHQESEAAKLFSEALEIDEHHAAAKLGTASMLADRFEGKALELANEALEILPDQIAGYLLLARAAIEESDLEKAATQLATALEKAEELEEAPLEIYALQASIDLLRGETESEWTRKALEYNPAYGQVYAEQAHFYVITRRYREAVELYRKAVEIDPELWPAHAELGVNLLREAKEEEGRRHLELAYQGDPYSAHTTNTLRLLDSFKNFETHTNTEDAILGSPEEIEASLKKPRVVLKLHDKEAKVLLPYVMPLAERSIQTFSGKYGFELHKPVQIELYPDHDDFAVRTMGMPGLGLLGVTFGYVIAMDSPSGRSPGSFHWGTTLWHEMAHVFTLESTNHLVPRWFSEGISMYEEWEADPSWGENISPDFLEAVEQQKLLPITELDRGFIRPRYRGQVAISYFQAGLVCKMVADQWGFDKIVAMLKGYAAGRSTEENVRQELTVAPEEFDKRFQKFIDEKYGAVVKALPEWRKALKEALSKAREKEWKEALEPALEAQRLYPEYVEAGNAYRLLAETYLQLGDKKAAAEQLQGYQKRGGRDPKSIKRLAGWLEELGRQEEAIVALEGLLYIAPNDAELHGSLGEKLLAANRPEDALREFEVALAMSPLDQASAHFNLAQTYHKMKDREKTRTHLLAALEAAPSYRPAQKLLLEITQ